ncbi:hypothetical protein EDF36_1793 [Rathayibacter sp. PhB152]|nr:hypothetical protein EDF36_1793 [Rathayibacter sp. PhB152]
MTGDGELDASELRALFQELSDRLEDRGQQASSSSSAGQRWHSSTTEGG